MNEIKRFIDIYIPTEVCNLKCSYCYIAQRDGFTGKVNLIQRTPEEVCRALSKKRFGGTMFLNFCAGGETLINAELLPILHALLEEGHYVQVVTNGTLTERFNQIASWEPDILERLFIKFSFHYLELKRLHLFETFWNNISIMREHGVSFTLEITPCDEMIPYIPEIKKVSMEHVGAYPHITVARNNQTKNLEILTSLDRENYKKTWGVFNSAMFDLKMKLLQEKRTEYCYAGEWTLYLNLATGDLKQCYKGDIIDNIYESAENPIHFRPIGRGCREAFCFNGHAWLTWGAIPELDIPTYEHIRNRQTSDGKEWLTPVIKGAFSHKLNESNVILENLDSKPKVALFGDSILKGAFPHIQEGFPGGYLYYNGEIARSSGYLKRYLHEWAYEMGIGSNIDVVVFNAGLWDILRFNEGEPMVSLTEYKRNIEDIILQCGYLFPQAKIVFSTSTKVIMEKWMDHGVVWNRRNRDIRMYNEAAISIVKKHGGIVNDLYKVSEPMAEDAYIDTTHFTENVYKKLAKTTLATINRYLNYVLAGTPLLKDAELKREELKERRVFVYGAGECGRMCVSELSAIGKKPMYVLDKNEQLSGSNVDGIEIITPLEYLKNKYAPGDLVMLAIYNQGIWNNVISMFTEKDITICSYKILQNFCD